MFANQQALVAKKMYDLFNKNELEKLLEFYSHDVEITLMSTGQVFRGHSGLQTLVEGVRKQFPDLTIYDITNQIVTEEYIVSEYKVKGTLERNKSTLTWNVCEVWKFRHGKIQGIHSYGDNGIFQGVASSA
jgi:ketosteroid isomerase-like protein